MSDLVENNFRVHVYCNKGQDQSPTLVEAYPVSAGTRVSTALKRTRKYRSSHLKRSQKNSWTVADWASLKQEPFKNQRSQTG